MKLSRIRILLCVLAVILVGLVVTGIIIFSSPQNYTSLMLSMGRYPAVVKYYNNHDINGSDKENVDSKLHNTIEEAYEKWDNSTISYDKAASVIQPFLVIKDDSLKELAESRLSYMKVENTGNEMLSEAESDFENKDYLGAMKCLEKVDKSYSRYSSLQDIYNESREILLNEIGSLRTEEEYKEAIKKLDGYLSEVNDDAFETKRIELESELSEYEDVHKIIERATESFENKKYKESFKTLEKGGEKYPNSNKIKYALSAYQYAYILTICGNVEVLVGDEDYDGAIDILEEAIDNYDCEQFEELLDSVKREDSIWYSIGASLSDAGDYVFTSARKLVLGDFDENEEETLLSLGGNIAASVTGVDAPLDARDLAYDIAHWGEGDYFAARFALDVVGVIPFIGAVKYLKHVDTVADAAKTIKKGADVADAAHDIANAADAAHDVANAADAAHDATNIADTVHDAANVADTAHDIANAAESAGDITKQIDEIVEDVVTDVTKKADIVPDLADDFSDVTKAADNAEEAVDAVDDIADSSKKADEAIDAAKAGDAANDAVDIGEDISKTAFKDLSEDVQKNYKRYADCDWDGEKALEDMTDGSSAGNVFKNKDEDLPIYDKTGKELSYTEYDVFSLGEAPDFDPKRPWLRGEYRFVRDNLGNVYFTKDHYESFTLITDAIVG